MKFDVSRLKHFTQLSRWGLTHGGILLTRLQIRSRGAQSVRYREDPAATRLPRNCALIKCNRYIPRKRTENKGEEDRNPLPKSALAAQSGTLPLAHNGTLSVDPVRRLRHADYTIIIWILLLRTYRIRMAYGYIRPIRGIR